MTELAAAEKTTEKSAANPVSAVPGRVPPDARVPKPLQAIGFAVARRWVVKQIARRQGDVFKLKLPIFGPTVMIADAQLAKQLFTANTDDVGNIQPNLSRILGSGSVFALDGTDHRRRRKLLTPPFHGKSIKNYERIFEEETLREMANWPQGQEFETLEPMMRITLNVILRAVFGADGEQLDELRRIIPPWVTLGSRLVVVPTPSRTYGRFSPWGRLARYRQQYDAVINRLIDKVEADPEFDQRDDILALLLRSTYEDGSAMSRKDIGDELLTLLAAGHETTASTLGWHSSESAGIRRCWPDSRPRPPPTATNTVRPPSSRCSATAPSSTSPAATCTPRQSGWGSGRFRADTPSSWRSRKSRRRRRNSPTRTASTRNDSSATGPAWAGCPTAAVPGAASGRCSPTSRWMWYCEQCCGTS